MNSANSFEGRINSLVGLLGSTVGRLLGADPRAGLERLVIASIVPILTTSFFYYTRTTVEVVDPEQSLWVQLWISQQKGSIRRVRRLFLLSHSIMQGRRDPYGYNSRRNNGEEEDSDAKSDRFAPPKLTFLPAGGISAWAWYGLWPVSVSSLEAPRQQDSYNTPSFAGSAGYKLTVWFAPLGADVAKKLLFEGRKMWLAKRAQKTEIWMQRDYHSPTSFKITTKKSRPLNSVIVEDKIRDALLADTKRFLQSEEWYVRKGIPYRRGYLLYGPPGCGKSSFITALAGSLRLPIVLITLGSKSIGDSEVFEALSAAPRDSIVLIEDVDCAFREDKDNDRRIGLRPVTMSGLLNAIDGVAAQEGRLIFLTTNHKEQLNEALIRPGRVDAQFYLGYASKTGAAELFDQFFPPSEDLDGHKLKLAREAFVNEVEPDVHSFAKLQGVLMKARDDPELAARGMRALYTEEESSNLKHIELKKLKGSKITRLERLDDNIEPHLALIEHASKCEGCTGSNCKTMKKYFDHAKDCKEIPKSACKTCTAIINLCVVHGQRCTVKGHCPVPYCDRIRKKEEQEEAAFVESLLEESRSEEKELPPPSVEPAGEAKNGEAEGDEEKKSA